MTTLDVPLAEPTSTTTAPSRPEIGPNTDHGAGGTPETGEHRASRYAFAVVRLSLGFVFLWAFVDKLVGLDHATPSARAWIHGGSPTTGFLKAVQGPFAEPMHSLAGSAWVDWLFMAGLLGIGLALMLGVGLRMAAATGAVLLVFMWAASLPLETNPFMDDHLVYAVVLVGLALTHAGDTVGLGRTWSRLPVVTRFPVLR
jgi:thiosulfate dehydrogenase [quinone] large subunit